jgi:hypothetical protein
MLLFIAEEKDDEDEDEDEDEEGGAGPPPPMPSIDRRASVPELPSAKAGAAKGALP